MKTKLMNCLTVAVLFIAGLTTGCAVAKQAGRFIGEGLKLVGTAANETGKAMQYAADSIQEPNE